MGANLPAACVLISALLVLPGKSTIAAVTVSPSNETSYSQGAGSASDAAVRLTRATLHITPTEATFTITTEAEGSLGLFHIYLDTDGDAATGYQPPSRKVGDLGADYLVEGGTLHLWAGGVNHAAWSWKPTGSVSVSRGTQSTIQVSVPLEKLNLKNSPHLRVLVETLTENWESADTLPRQGIWDMSRTGSQGGDSTPLPSVAPPSTPPSKPIETAHMEQGGQSSAHKSASLVRASVGFEGDTLLVKVVTEATPDLAKYHLYIDADMNVSTGFHATTSVAGLGGADFLCEGGFLYAWDGNQNQTAWTWRKIVPVTVTPGAEKEFQIAVPLAPLNLQGRKQIQLLIETIDDNWKTEDVIPRDRSWVIKLPDRF
jgi:hypothetical protein